MDAAIWRNFRKLSLEERRSRLAAAGLSFPEADWSSLADRMIEQAIGFMPVPLGLATGFLIDGRELALPLATEEPSVVAAATFAATRIARHGGFATSADPAIMEAQIFLEFDQAPSEGLGAKIAAAESSLRSAIEGLLTNMTKRGGGWRSLRVSSWPEIRTIKVSLMIDVVDAMGANLLNSCAEALREPLETLTGGRVLMGILSNQAPQRLARAQFSLPLTELARGDWSGPEAAHRIVAATQIAALDPSRAITHNKGIMNGVSALALATGNDTRAVEAAAHAHALRNGAYQPLTTYSLDEAQKHLIGRIELPMVLGTVGGATQAHPVARQALGILGEPNGQTLARYAAALGLAQNFAAIAALTAEGIQAGHMKLHARRQAPGAPI